MSSFVDAPMEVAEHEVLVEQTSTEEKVAPTIQMPAPEVLQFNIALDAKPKTRDQSRERLLKYIDDTCCWGSGPAKACEFETCNGLSSFNCKLESFVEYRTSQKVHKPYVRGTRFSSPNEGVAPHIWSMNCNTQPFFRDITERFEIPFTSTVCTCFNCRGKGQVRCTACGGDGKTRCGHCGGDGRVTHTVHRDGKSHKEHKNCHSCHATGHVNCSRCGGDGRVTCGTCAGNGLIRYFNEMTRVHVTLVNQRVVKDSISDADLPDKLIQEAKGTTVLEKNATNIAPPKGFNDNVDRSLVEIDEAAKHQVENLRALLHQERVTIKSVPITFSRATHGSDKFRWYIYGTDDRIEIHDYPATMCCGCEIA